MLGIRTLSKSRSLFIKNYQNQVILTNFRNLSSIEISKNLELITNNKEICSKKDIEILNKQGKPLVILITWLLAKRKHVNKFANYYVSRGFDVLNVSSNPWQLLWPTKGTQVTASNMLKFLETNATNSPLVLHGFSVGGYVWSEVLVKMATDRKRYEPIVNRVAGQVWDSIVDVTELCIGVPVAVFPKNLALQNALKQYLLYHLKTFDKIATCHYIRASQMFHTNLIRAPAHFFLSKSDPIGAEKPIRRARENWENIGIKVSWKIWDHSPHVGHFRLHPTVYVEELDSFLNSIGLLGENKLKLEMKN